MQTNSKMRIQRKLHPIPCFILSFQKQMSSSSVDGDVLMSEEDGKVSVATMVAAQTGKLDRSEIAEIIGEDGDAAYPNVSARLIEAMQDFTPTFPDNIMDHILAKSGFQSSDPKLFDFLCIFFMC